MPISHISIAATGSTEIEVKKSRFICTVDRAATDAEARAFIASMKKQCWDANHNCSAYVVGERRETQRSSDDGEPSGTAGVPMLNVLLKRGLTNTVAVVTRYFGGTRLGAGGLIRAYGQIVSQTIDAIGTIERKEVAQVALLASFEDAGRLENALRAEGFDPDDVTYSESVTMLLTVDPAELPEFSTWVAEQTSGRVTVEARGIAHTEVPYIG